MIFCVLLCFALLASQVVGQTLSPPSQGCERRTVVVTVINKTGPVMNLDKSSFQLESKPPVAKVISATPRKQTPRAMIVLDISGSMRGPGKLRVVAALARGIIEAAPPKAPLALVTFTEQIKERFDFSASKEILVQKVEAIGRDTAPSARAKDMRTALRDSLTEAIKMFGVAQPADAIFLISDGGDNHSRTRASVLRRSLLEGGLRVFSFLPYERVSPAEEVIVGLDEFLDLSRETGGQPMPLENRSRSAHWDDSTQGLALAEEMGKYMYVLAASNYQLEIETDRPIQSPVKLKLRIVSSDGKESHNVQPLYPHELMPCAANPRAEVTLTQEK